MRSPPRGAIWVPVLSPRSNTSPSLSPSCLHPVPVPVPVMESRQPVPLGAGDLLLISLPLEARGSFPSRNPTRGWLRPAGPVWGQGGGTVGLATPCTVLCAPGGVWSSPKKAGGSPVGQWLMAESQNWGRAGLPQLVPVQPEWCQVL